MYSSEKYRTARAMPMQPRGKETVRTILAASLALFKDQGFEDVTTNDIAAKAQIPIGSLYRYYPNKDAVIVALTSIYVDDLCDMFDNIAKHPFLAHLSWDEILMLMVDAWVIYSKLNGPFVFLYAEKNSPHLRELNKASWDRFEAAFENVIRKHCKYVTDREMFVCRSMSLAATQLGVSEVDETKVGPQPHHEIVGATARYMLEACGRHNHKD